VIGLRILKGYGRNIKQDRYGERMKQRNDFFEHNEFEAPVRERKAPRSAAPKAEPQKTSAKKEPVKKAPAVNNNNGENGGKKKGKKALLIVVICVLVVAIAAAAFFVYYTQQQKQIAEEQQKVVETIQNLEVFHEGVEIDGVNVTGLTKEEAKAYIEAAHAEEDVKLVYSVSANAAYSEAKAAADQRAAEEAAKQEAAAAEAAKAVEDAPEDAEDDTEGEAAEPTEGGEMMLDENGVPIEVVAEEETPEELLYTIDAEGNFVINAEQIKITRNIDEILEEAFSLAKEGTYEELMAEVADIKANGREYNTTYTIDVSGAKAVVEQIADAVHIDAVDASVEFNTEYTGGKESEEGAAAVDKFKYIDEINGLDLDVEATFAALEALAANGEAGSVEMVTVETPAATTVEDVKGKVTLRGSFMTDFKGSRGYAERVWNITKAAGMINGKVVQPGETFSMNDSIGKRTKANGWKMAGALSGGQSDVKQYGGGVCQVSTTLYNAVVMGDLEVVYRQAHSEKSSYVAGGLDATINSVGNIIDFKWRNNTNSPVIIIAYTVDKELYVDVYGEPFATDEYDEIKLTSKQIGTIQPPGEEKFQLVEGKPATYKEVKVKRRTGSKWQSYKNYYKNGELVKTEKLATSTYKAYAGLTLVGALPDASPSVSPDGTTPSPSPDKETATPSPDKETTKPSPDKETATPSPDKETTKPSPDKETETKPESDNKTETETKPESDNKTETETKPESDNKTETETKPESGNKTETETKPESDNKTETETKPESGNKTETEAKPESDNKTDSGAEA